MSLPLKNIDQEGNVVVENVAWEQLDSWPVHQRLRQYEDLIKYGFCDWLSDISIMRLLELARNNRSVGLIDALVWSRFHHALHPPRQSDQRHPPPPDVPTALEHFRQDVWFMNEADERVPSNNQPMIFLLPVHANRNHWTLAAHVEGSDHCTYMDSRNPSGLPSQVYQDAITIWSETISGRRLPLQSLRDIDRQSDGHSCGVHLVLNARYCIERRASFLSDRPLDYVALRCSMWNEIAEYEASMIRSANRARRSPLPSQNDDIMIINSQPNVVAAKDKDDVMTTDFQLETSALDDDKMMIDESQQPDVDAVKDGRSSAAPHQRATSQRRRRNSAAIRCDTPSKTLHIDDNATHDLQDAGATTSTTSQTVPATQSSFIDVVAFTQHTTTPRTQQLTWNFPIAPAASFDLVPLVGVPGYDRFREFLSSAGVTDTSIPMDQAMLHVWNWTVDDIFQQRQDLTILPMQRFSKSHQHVIPFHVPAVDDVSAFVVPVLLDDAHFIIAVSKAAKGKHGFKIHIMAPFKLCISAKLRVFFRDIAKYLFDVDGVRVTVGEEGVDLHFVPDKTFASAYYCHVVDCIGKATLPLDVDCTFSTAAVESRDNRPSTSTVQPSTPASKLANAVTGLSLLATSTTNDDVNFDFFPSEEKDRNDFKASSQLLTAGTNLPHANVVDAATTSDNTTTTWTDSTGVQLFRQYLDVVGVAWNSTMNILASHVATWTEDLTTSFATDVVYLPMQFFTPLGLNSIVGFTMGGRRKGQLRLKYLVPIVFDNHRFCFALLTSAPRCVVYAAWPLSISNDLRLFLRSIGSLVYGSRKDMKCALARDGVDLRHVDSELISAYYFHLVYAIVTNVHPLLHDEGFRTTTLSTTAKRVVQPLRDNELLELTSHSSQVSHRRRKTAQKKAQRTIQSPAVQQTIKLENAATHRLAYVNRHKDLKLPMYRRAMIGKPFPEYYNIGRLGEDICPYCKALLFKHETRKCCSNGKVKLSEFDIEKYPEPLRSLYLSTHPKSEHFKQNARAYNNFMAFASTTMAPRKDLSKHGIPVVTIHGRMYHHQSHAFPPNRDASPAFAQYYYYDTAEATRKRSESKFGAGLDKDLLQELDAMMRQNPFYQAYLMAFEAYAKEPKATNIRALIVSSRSKQARQVVDLRTTHPGRLNVPKLTDCLAVVYSEDKVPDLKNQQYIMVNRSIGGKITAAHNTIAFHNPDRLSLCYPLLFPTGERFYEPGVSRKRQHGDNRQAGVSDDDDDDWGADDNDSEADFAAHARVRTKASLRDVATYHLHHRRPDRRHFMFEFRHLGQQLLIDLFLAVEHGRLAFVKKNWEKMRVALKTDLLTYLQKKYADRPVKIGRHISLPAKFTGGPRYQAHLFHNCSALFSALGRPQFFITFTGNPNWPEIKESLRAVDKAPEKKTKRGQGGKQKDAESDGDVEAKGQSAFDVGLITARVFHAKKVQLMREIKEGALGNPVAWAYHIEFQKRGMPHMHLLLTTDIKISCPEEFDEWISAEIPEDPSPDDSDYDIKKSYIDLVKRNLVHGPCEVPTGKGDPWPCRANKFKQNRDNKCDKWFPRDFRDETEFTTHGYVEAKRPDNGRTFEFGNGRRVATNQHVVAHNPYFIVRFGAHINVEIINCGEAAVIYIFKYINKGNDQAVLELRTKLIADAEAQGLKLVDIDECAEYEQLRFMTSCEAAYRLLGFPLCEMSHTVVELPVHEEGKESVALEEGNEEEAERKVRLRQNSSQLTAYFALCSYDPAARSLRYLDVPLDYSFDKQRYCWKRRGRRDAIVTRIQWVNVSQQERYAIRVLLYHRRGVTSYDDLFTVNSTVHPTAFAAAVASGLMADDKEWGEAMEEAVKFQLPASARRTFAMILTHATSTNFLDLWETYKTRMTNQHRHKSPEVMEQHALAHIASILKHAGKTLSDFNLPDPNESLIKTEEAAETKEKADKAFKEAYGKMNAEQKQLTDAFLDCVAKPKTDRGKCIFVQASGGCGKTLTANAIINACEVRGHAVLVSATTGIAAVQLRGGRTAHSAFKLSIRSKEIESTIQAHLQEGEALQDLDAVIIDEVVMQTKGVLEAINTVLCDVALRQHKDIPFGGVAVLLCGDWKQLLPVVLKASEQQIVSSTLRKSPLWDEFRQMSLRTNMRADPDQKQFADWLEKVGSGRLQVKAADGEECIRIPPEMIVQSAEDVINWIYTADIMDNPAALANVAILTVQNKRTMELNDKVMNMLPTAAHTLLGSNTVVVDVDQNPDVPIPQPESLADLLPSGFPPTRLILKVGCVIMLLRNLDVKNGLCNGTRLVVLKICNNRLLHCRRIDASADDEDVLIPRIDLEYEDESRQLRFRRRQFPVRPAFSMTINKSQGQTFAKVGIILYDPVFAHGHLYVALSRVRNAGSIRIATPGFNAVRRIGGNLSDVYVRNVVYKEVLPNSS